MATPLETGIGWREPHHRELLERRPRLDFIEVHAENFFAAGGAAPALLAAAREHHELSLHGVGLALGSAAGIDEDHLAQLARLVERTEPCLVSDHLCFARARLGGRLVHANDLLPLARTGEALDIAVANVQRVQERLRRTIAVENVVAYLRWREPGFDEAAFLNALAHRAGCTLLLDLNNLVVDALNDGDEPVARACAVVDRIDAAAVSEIHLAGYRDDGALVIDDHGSRVHEPVWQVYRHALQRFGPRPTLIEWDTGLPALDVLRDEAAKARACIAELRR